MLDSIFLNLIRGNRLSQYMGLNLNGNPPMYGPAYSYVEVDLDPSKNEQKLLRNQHVYIQPWCSVHIRGDYHLLVEPNPALAEWGSVQAPYWIHSGDIERVPGFWITLRKDLNLADIKYAVRLYLQV